MKKVNSEWCKAKLNLSMEKLTSLCKIFRKIGLILSCHQLFQGKIPYKGFFNEKRPVSQKLKFCCPQKLPTKLFNRMCQISKKKHSFYSLTDFKYYLKKHIKNVFLEYLSYQFIYILLQKKGIQMALLEYIDNLFPIDTIYEQKILVCSILNNLLIKVHYKLFSSLISE